VASDVTPVVEQFNAFVKEVEGLLSIARATELQEQACTDLEHQRAVLAEEKQRAIESLDEDYANFLLGCECVCRTLMSELRMWLLLKTEKPEEAWNELITAQETAAAAARAHEGFSHLRRHGARLEAVERLVFPPQLYLSSGFIAKVQQCTICEAEYGCCDHLAGKAYMGKFCQIRFDDVTVDHVSIVDQPADKRCRVTSFNDEGGKRNRMTWRLSQTHDV
jgi:hypothetical protein